jgi:hypothetical protein
MQTWLGAPDTHGTWGLQQEARDQELLPGDADNIDVANMLGHQLRLARGSRSGNWQFDWIRELVV